MADDAPAGVPEWIVTYGDMMSLLLTFFIMLVSLSEVNGDAKYQAMIQAIMQHMGYVAGPSSPPGDGFPLSGMIERLKTLGSFTDDKKNPGTGGIKTPGPEGEDLRVFRGREGTSINLSGPLGFAPGSAEIPPETAEVIKTIAQKLAGKPNKIDVRGHTSLDPLPAGSKFTDKVHLSYERGRAVLEMLQKYGIQRDRMRISAVADTEPLPPSPDKKSVQPDRVEIFVLDAFARDFVGPRDVPQ